MHVRTLFRVILLGLAYAAGSGAWAAPLMPFEDKWEHVGVATSAGSNSQGSQRPVDD